MQHENSIAASSPDNDEDEDLFGPSPPPSPIRGRSPFLGLALPNSSSGVSLLSQNVGTIALPGSQHGSKLAVNSLALPFIGAHPGLLRPPAQDTSSTSSDLCRLQDFGPRSSPSSTSSSPYGSRASSSAPTTARSKKKRSKSIAGDRSSRPPPPVIPLPDPSEPLPPNWLRSQSALLGHAGLVGGIKPATLSLCPRGSTPSNPIIVDDQDEKAAAHTPVPVREHPRPPRRIHYAAIDNMGLPAPSTKDIVDILLRQREVVPVLQDLLKIVSKGAVCVYCPSSHTSYSGAFSTDSSYLSKPTSSSQNHNDPSYPPPPKRRKLNDVPAGAVDWDVPYPFHLGEGPQKYQDSWAHERVKELVLQLVALIKTASRKAALRNYIKQQQSNGGQDVDQGQPKGQNRSEQHISARKELEHAAPKTHGHYKPATAFYGLDMSNIITGTDTTNSSTCAVTQPSPADPSNDTIDQVITTLLSAPADHSTQSNPGDLPVPETPQTSALYTSIDDPDGWLSLLQSFPMPQGYSQENYLFPDTSVSDLSGTTTLAIGDAPMDFGSWGCPDISRLESWEASHDIVRNPAAMDSDLTSLNDSVNSRFHDANAEMAASIAISTLLSSTPVTSDELSTSIPQVMPSGTPSLVASPMPSMSSIGDIPMAPPSPAGMDFNGGPDVAIRMSHDLDMMNAVSSPMALGGESGSSEKEKTQSSTSTSAHQTRQGGDVGDMNPSTQEGLRQTSNLAQMEYVAVKNVLPMLLSASAKVLTGTPTTLALAPTSSKAHSRPQSTQSTPSSRPSQPPKKSLERGELLKLAKERRKQLVEEIIKTRTQLWETTIEHGVLTHLSKYYNNAP
ncbi:hypothetical protein Moror_14351 [Moniliophthora roreri MCA 2997]|uniref:Uncharacterized protein n=1 Tax=Moniliophthora roreri (strain MCA 2997) TaxID=1381753 RepID=V2XLM6_MONRO|nr:hypothetical protein Moror_14351 [Moniliophthora roreri MCA 2997]